MRYVSLDIETTGLDPDADQVLQIAMIVEDSAYPEVPIEDLPSFNCLIKHERISGNAFALGMNSWILDAITGRKPINITTHPIYSPLEAYDKAWWFLSKHFGAERITVAGKNVAGFDLPFLPRHLRDMFRHQVIDAGSVLIDWSAPSVKALPELLWRPVEHDALADARAVIEVLRTTYNRSK